MTAEHPDDAEEAPPKVAPESVALRATPQPVTRLNRRMLAVLVGGVSAMVLGATMWSLQPQKRLAGASEELYNVDKISQAEGLSTLPRDYSQVPSPPATPAPPLGPPLPGDLGRPMLRAQQDTNLRPHGGPDPAEVERLARLKEAQDAARAPIFYKGINRGSAPAGAPPSMATPGGAALAGIGGDAAPVDPMQTQNMQDNKTSFSGQGTRATQSTHRLEAPRAPDTLMAGTVIAAALVTGIKSDLPGDIIATVTEPVYDSATHQHVLLPQGSQLIGRYNSQVAYGQSRAQAVWDRIILHDTSSVTLDNLAATDPAGYAGLEDDMDWHWDRVLAGAALTTLLGVGAELAAPENRIDGDRVIIAGRDSAQDSVNQIGQEMTRRNMNIQPTLTIRPGMPVQVIVSRDITLRPYRPLFINR